MSYTLWSHGRLVGHTDLDLPWDDVAARRGWLQPAPDTSLIFDIAIGVELARLAAEQTDDRETAAADVASALDRYAALELELHGPDGKPIETSEIAISDTVVAVFGSPDGDKIWYDQLSEEERRLFDESVERQREILDELAREQREYGEEVDPDDDFDADDLRYEVVVKFPE